MPPALLAVRFAVPSFLVLLVAVKLLISVAFAVAPALTTKISLSDPPVPPKSVIVSVPRSTLKRSFPALPVKAVSYTHLTLPTIYSV